MPRKKTVDVPAVTPALSAVPRPRARTTKPKANLQAVAAPVGPTHDEIAEAAYLRFLSRGASHGSDLDDWVEAERELSHRHGLAKTG
jgi:hypothetical protein